MPEARSLLAWISSVCGEAVSALSGMKTGRQLLLCLKTIDPDCDVDVDTREEYWLPVLEFLGKRFECDLKRCVDLQKLEEGEEEHIGRITVLLLCHAVQCCSTREATISAITQLDTSVQSDIKTFIEEGLAAVTSHTLEAGMFHSGIDVAQSSAVSMVTPDRQPNDAQPMMITTPFVTHTPSSVCLSRRRARTILDTPAALHWLGSPSSVSSDQSSAEALHQVQFKLSISEKALMQERLLCEELSSELTNKISIIDDLGSKHTMEMSEQQRKHEQALRDLEDELVHLRQQIVSFETSETKMKRHLTTLMEDHNKKLEESIEREKQQQQQVDQMGSLMTEQSAQLQKVGIKLKVAEAEIHTMSQLITKIRSCQSELETEKVTLLSKHEVMESAHRAKVEEMSSEMERLTAELSLYQSKHSEAHQQLQICRDDHASQIAVMKEERDSLVTAHETELATLRQNLSSSHSTNAELRQELEQTKDKLEAAIEKEQSQQQSINDLTALVDKWKAQLQKVEEKLSEVVASGQRQLQQCQDEHAAQLAAMKEERDALVVKHESKLASLKTNQETELASLRHQLSSSQFANTELQQQLDMAMNKECAQLQSIDKLTGVINNQVTELQQLEERIAQYEQKNCQLMLKLKSCQSELETSRDTILSKQDEMESAHRAKVEEMSSEMESLTAELSSYQARYQEAQEALRKIETSHSEQLSEIRGQNISSAAMLDLRSKKLTALYQRISEMEQHQQSLVTDLKHTVKLRDQYLVQLHQSESRYRHLEDKYQHLSMEKAQTDSNFSRLVAEKQSLETQLEYASQQLRNKEKKSSSQKNLPIQLTNSQKSERTSQKLASVQTDLQHLTETDEEKEEDYEERASELQRRNAQRLPHLRSSYPVELQVQLNPPSLSDEAVMALRPSSSSSSSSSTTTTTTTSHVVQHHARSSPRTSSRSAVGRKRSNDHQAMGLDVLISSPPVKKMNTCRLALKRSPIVSAHRNAGSELKLRSYLDTSPKLHSSENSTAFEIEFSPPKKKSANLPPRLRVKEAQSLVTSRPVRTATVMKKSPHPSLALRTMSRTKKALGSVNK